MRWFDSRVLVTACLIIALPLAAVAQAPASAAKGPTTASPAPAATPASTTPASGVRASVTPPADPALPDHVYTMGMGDTIEVALVGRTDFTTRAKIGSDGAVLLPYIGAVMAVGRAPSQFADEISKALEKGGFFAQPVVRVDIVGVGSRNVTVLGSVATPGLLSLDRDYHLSEIIARVGGRIQTGVDYVVLTHSDGSQTTYKLTELATGSGDKDPFVANGDKIYVPAAENQIFYIQGQIRNPGAFPVAEGMTVRTALARAGGVTDQGSEKKVTVKRKGTDLRGINLDVTTLQPGDIVTVGERLF